jgi:23S rRNA A2030 N6-methylase RlmJ
MIDMPASQSCGINLPSRDEASCELASPAVNYNHEFYAGNFADVFKHAVLCRVLHYLRGKPAAFRVIDTHAGAGVYDLTGEKSTRGGEWQAGIGKLMAAQTLEQWRSCS